MGKITFITIIIMILTLPLGQIEKIPLGITSVSIYLHDTILVLAIIFAVINFRKSIKKVLNLPLLLPLLAFIFFSFSSLLVNSLQLKGSDWIVATAYLIRFLAYATLYPLLKLLVVEKRSRGFLLLYLLFFVGVIVTFEGLSQYLLYPKLRNLYYLGWDPHAYRLFSTFFDPNFTGIILVFTIFLGIYLMRERLNNSTDSNRWMTSLFFPISLLATFIALVLTYSRSSYLTFVVGLPLLFFRKKYIKYLIAAYFILFVSIYFLPRPFGEGVRLERTSTIQSRVKNYQQTVKIIKQYPFFGVGFNAYRYALHQMGYLSQLNWREIHSGSGADNSFLFAWATAGIGGFLSIIWLLFRGFIKGCAFIRATIISLIVHSFFVNSLFYPWVMIWLWVTLGINEGFKAGK